MQSILTKEQRKQFERSYKNSDGENLFMRLFIRYDDRCNNGHNSFSITADIFTEKQSKNSKNPYMCGCCHDEIKIAFPEFAHLIKWHLMNSDGPMYYIENTLYHADEHGPNSAHVYFNEPITGKSLLLEYCDEKDLIKYWDESKKIFKSGYIIKWDEKTAKKANLEGARKTAIWPDATIEQLRNKCLLIARLPDLIEQFKKDIEAIGFIF